MRKSFPLLLLLFASIAHAQPKTNTFLQKILLSNNDSLYRHVLAHAQYYRLQIIYTQINRDKNNKPLFTNYYFNVDSLFYFNPASTVKLPLAALSLEKLYEMNINGVNKYSPMLFDSGYAHQRKELTDSTSQTGLPSVGQFIRKAFLISDNDAYNRMYEFVGQQRINKNLHSKGYKDIRITRQFMGFSEEENRHTNPIQFLDSNHRVIYTQPAQYNTDSFDYSHTIKMGKGHWDNHDSLINEPIDFTKANNLPLEDLRSILQSILFPLSVGPKQRFNLSKNDYDFLKQYLSQYPSETSYPKYDTSVYYDSYVKFFFQDSGHAMPQHLRVFNKVGWAYGFLTDASYVADFKNNIEYMLAATVYVNSDDILNDNKYDFETVGHPFMYQLGQTIYNYELHRTRKYKPDLNNFKIYYERRNAGDTRVSVKDADN